MIDQGYQKSFIPDMGGVTFREGLSCFTYQLDYVFNNLGGIDPETIASKRARVEK